MPEKGQEWTYPRQELNFMFKSIEKQKVRKNKSIIRQKIDLMKKPQAIYNWDFKEKNLTKKGHFLNFAIKCEYVIFFDSKD